MERYIVVSAREAAEKNYPDVYWDSPYQNTYFSCLYVTDGEKPVRLLATDGGEPEDQTFGRDWNWVLKELNKLAQEIAGQKRKE